MNTNNQIKIEVSSALDKARETANLINMSEDSSSHANADICALKPLLDYLDVQEEDIMYSYSRVFHLSKLDSNFEGIRKILASCSVFTLLHSDDNNAYYSYISEYIVNKNSCTYNIQTIDRNMIYDCNMRSAVTRDYDSNTNTVKYCNLKKDGVYEIVCRVNLISSSTEIVHKELNNLITNKIPMSVRHPIRADECTESPKYKLLSGNPSDGFYLTNIKTDKLNVDVESNYPEYVNDYYKRVNEFIQEEDSTGLVMLKGLPGTGKTSLINKWMQDNPDSNFIYINDKVLSYIESPEFVGFLSSLSNSILILEDQENILADRKTSYNPLISTLLNVTSGMLSSSVKCKIIVTYNYDVTNIEVDSALKRKGRLVADVNIGKLSLEKTKKLAEKLGYNPDDFEEESLLADIYNHEVVNIFGEDSDRKRISFMNRE